PAPAQPAVAAARLPKASMTKIDRLARMTFLLEGCASSVGRSRPSIQAVDCQRSGQALASGFSTDQPVRAAVSDAGPGAADHDRVAREARVVLRVIDVVVKAAALGAAARALDDQVRAERDVAQLDEIARDRDVPVVVADLVAYQLDPARGALQAAIAADD